ncbi:hypothetical protein WA026_004148 [Henosepilachna vigintioctopunctata]|uniref:Uncharacterized protein n=1 Tax=Henosepilachna vigintioctopunctata TaxID=420089 RepID=A0AAW1U9R2_9CUCU
MDWGQLYILLGLTLYTIQIEGVHSKSASESQDTLKQWKDHELICGFPSTKLSLDSFYKSANTSQNATENAWEMNTINISDSLETEDYPDMLNDEKNQSMRQIIINYENFECCLKNIVINIRNPEQRERCLASFFQCVIKTETEKCKTQWRFYMNLILHDERFMLVVIFILVSAFIGVMFSTYKCNDELPTLGRDHFRRY